MYNHYNHYTTIIIYSTTVYNHYNHYTTIIMYVQLCTTTTTIIQL